MSETIAAIGTNLAAAAIGAAATYSWRRWIHPLFVERFFEPTKISGEYSGPLDFGNGPSHGISLRIKKLGYGVKGTLRFTRGRHAGKEYDVSGRYWHGLLTFTYSPVDLSSTSQGAATFQRRQDGTSLVGAFAYYSQEGDVVATVASVLQRS